MTKALLPVRPQPNRRHRAVGLLAVIAVLSGVATIAPARAGGSFTRHTFGTPGRSGTRDYWQYVPGRLPSGRHPLVVFLHGCTQTAPEAAAATKLNALADRKGFVVVYPQQNTPANSTAPVSDGNGTGCWNWFLPEDQARDKGEPAAIAGITRIVTRAQHIDPNRVYIAGISAGADMAVILGATYPDVYASIGVVAGCAYATCGDASGALAYRAMGTRARIVPAFIEQGTADALNAYPLGRGLVDSWLGADDFADDGTPNASVSRKPATIANEGYSQTPNPGSGDTCVRNREFPCLGGAIGFHKTYPYTVERYADGHGCNILDFWTIHGLAHAYPKTSEFDAFGDPLGPDITPAMFDFFMRHPRAGRCVP